MIRKILILGDAQSSSPALERWFKDLPAGTILLPYMRDGTTVARLRRMARPADISITLSLSGEEKLNLATEVAVIGAYEYGAQERAVTTGLPWSIVDDEVEEADGEEEQPSLFD